MKKHRSLIAFELEVVSTKIDRFGWGQMSAAMKDRLTADWADALDPYRLDEVKAACAALMRSKPAWATNEQQVKKTIITSRGKALSRLPKQIEVEPEMSEPASIEQREAIMAELGFRPKGV